MTTIAKRKTVCKNSLRMCIEFISAVLIVTSIILCVSRINTAKYIISMHAKNRSTVATTPGATNNDPKNCIVQVINSGGRLGNRIFMVASAYGLARLHLCHLYLAPEIVAELQSVFVLNLAPFLISIAKYNLTVNNPSKPMVKIVRTVGCYASAELMRPNAIASGHIFELQGYWQSYLHFDKYREELRSRIFIGKQPILENVSKFFTNIYGQKFNFHPKLSTDSHHLLKNQLAESGWITWIGIHVRRTDFVSINFASSDQYLLFAIEYYEKLYSNSFFIVASDDKLYCQNLLRNATNIFITPESFSMRTIYKLHDLRDEARIHSNNLSSKG